MSSFLKKSERGNQTEANHLLSASRIVFDERLMQRKKELNNSFAL
jgi:hypothetical protein